MGMEVTSTTNSTSTKSTRSTTLTTKDSSSPTMTGTDKSKWCTKAIAGLEEIILCKHPRYYKNPTQAQIDQFHALLRERAKVWVGLQKDKLYGQVECTYQRIKSRISQWKLCSEQMVYKVKANWEACLASRKSKLSVFSTCLYGKRTHQRACLEKRLRECARVH